LLGWLGIGLAVILVLSIYSLNSIGQEIAAKASNTAIRPVSELISLNSMSVAKDITIPEQNRNCGNFKVKIGVSNDVVYENDKLIIQGYAPHGAKLEGRLIPLDGVTHGKNVDIPLKGSHFVYLLHQFGPEDKKLEYAAIVNALKETSDGTCLLGDYKIIEYKGVRK